MNETVAVKYLEKGLLHSIKSVLDIYNAIFFPAHREGKIFWTMGFFGHGVPWVNNTVVFSPLHYLPSVISEDHICSLLETFESRSFRSRNYIMVSLFWYITCLTFVVLFIFTSFSSFSAAAIRGGTGSINGYTGKNIISIDEKKNRDVFTRKHFDLSSEFR